MTSDLYLAPVEGPVVVDGVAWFWNDDGIHGRELWRSDGTAAGTGMLRDLCPGECGSFWLLSTGSIAATSAGIFFAADDGVHGQELWITDGTAAGTRLVRDIEPGWRGSQPGFFVAGSDTLWFWRWLGESGLQLWKSDGTEVGTRPVVDDGLTWRGAAATLGDLLLFAQQTDGLWRSDGTDAGTYPLSDAAGPDSNWSANAPFVTFGGRVVFAGDDDDNEWDPTLWVSDGSPTGTHELLPVADPQGFASDGSALWFVAAGGSGNASVWRLETNLTTLEEYPLPPELYPRDRPGRAATFAGDYYFTARDSAHGEELWRIHAGVPELFLELVAGPGSSFPFGIEEAWTGTGPFLAALPGQLLFFADDGVHGLELWRTDGTAGGTSMVADLVPGPEGTRIEFYRSLLPQTAVGGRLLFETRTSAGGVDLWATDGTAPGTLRLRSLRESTSSTPAPQPGASIYGTPQVSCFAPVGKGLLLAADDGEHGLEPWHVDPRTGAAHLVADLAPGEAWSSPAPCARVGGVGVFAAITSEPFSDFASLVATSGAAGDATLLSDLPSAWGLWPKTYVADRLLLASAGIWATDGSPAATETLELLEESFEDLVPLGDRLLAAGSVLYVTDGTPGALLSLDPPTAEDLVYPHRLTRLGDRALFFGWQNSTGQELWSTDGTPEGTAPVVEIRPGAASAIPEGFPSPDRYLLSRLVPLDGAAYFAADDGVHGEELWRTDGTPGGTALAADLFPGPYPSVPRELARVGRWLFFSAESPTAGRELWATDGGSGAPILFDLQPGPGSSVPERLTAIGSHLYFSAWTPGHGREPWRLSAASDGPSSPSRIADIAPGPLSSSPLVFGNVGADVVTIANDNLTGFEPWKLRDPDVLFADDFESSGLELWDPKAP